MTNFIETLKTARELKAMGFEDIREIMENVNDDFEAEGYRFISTCAIDQIMIDELLSDEYMLGCFMPWFISSITGLNQEAIEAIQKSNSPQAIEGLGMLMAEKIEEVQGNYISHDGYGHHFAHYDGEEQELHTGQDMFHVFRID